MNEGRQHQDRGRRTEATVTSELGVAVSAPVFGHERYDRVIDDGRDLERAQVKTAYDHTSARARWSSTSTVPSIGTTGRPRRRTTPARR